MISSTCRLCKSNKLQNIFIVNHRIIEKCLNCGFIQMAGEYDDIENIYNESYFINDKYSDNTCLERENNRRQAILRKYASRGSSVLDVGCATGDFLKSIKTEYEIFGCDFSNCAIDIAKKNNPDYYDRFWSGKVEDCVSSINQYDIICLWDVIEHIKEPFEVCYQLFEHLKPGGYMLISTPDIGSVFSKVCGKFWPFMTPPEHISFFNRESLRYLFNLLDNTKLIKSISKGKWANFGFILYKVGRIIPKIVKNKLFTALQKSVFSRLAIYVPTSDIQYAVIKKI